MHSAVGESRSKVAPINPCSSRACDRWRGAGDLHGRQADATTVSQRQSVCLCVWPAGRLCHDSCSPGGGASAEPAFRAVGPRAPPPCATTGTGFGNCCFWRAQHKHGHICIGVASYGPCGRLLGHVPPSSTYNSLFLLRELIIIINF